MKKAPTNRGPLVRTWITPFGGRLCYFFFLAGAFFFGAAFLVALFIDLFLPNIKFCDLKNRNVIHI